MFVVFVRNTFAFLEAVEPYGYLPEPVVGNESPDLIGGFATDSDLGAGVPTADGSDARGASLGLVPLEICEHASRRRVLHHCLSFRLGDRFSGSLGMFLQDREHVLLSDLFSRLTDRLVGYFAAHGMNLARISLVKTLFQLVLTHPERFARSEVPCCLQGLWEQQMDQIPALDTLSQPALRVVTPDEHPPAVSKLM